MSKILFKITLMLIFFFFLSLVAKAEVPDPCYNYGPPPSYHGPFVESFFPDKDNCPECAVAVLYYWRNNNSDLELQIVQIFLNDEDECSQCDNVEELFQMALRILWNRNPMGWEKEDPCNENIAAQIASCVEYTTEPWPGEIDPPSEFIDPIGKNKSDGNEIMETLFPTYKFCTGSACCKGYYKVCWEDTLVSSVETLGIETYDTTCTDMSNCEPACGFLDYNWTSSQGIINSNIENNVINTESLIKPNPSEGTFSLFFESAMKGKFNLIIHDGLGKEVYKLKFDKNQNFITLPIDLGSLTNGSYFYNIMKDGEKVTNGSFNILK